LLGILVLSNEIVRYFLGLLYYMRHVTICDGIYTRIGRMQECW